MIVLHHSKTQIFHNGKNRVKYHFVCFWGFLNLILAFNFFNHACITYDSTENIDPTDTINSTLKVNGQNEAPKLKTHPKDSIKLENTEVIDVSEVKTEDEVKQEAIEAIEAMETDSDALVMSIPKFKNNTKKDNLSLMISESANNPKTEKAELLTMHNWLYHHVPISKNIDGIIEKLTEGVWSVELYSKLTELIDARAKFLGIWTDCPTNVALKYNDELTLGEAVSHVVNLYKYRDVKVLQLDQEVTELSSDRVPGDYREFI